MSSVFNASADVIISLDPMTDLTDCINHVKDKNDNQQTLVKRLESSLTSDNG